MKEDRRRTLWLVAGAGLLQLLLLGREYLTGGVVSHHVLHDPALPAISNYWGLLVLPSLALLTARRSNRELRASNGSPQPFLPWKVWLGFGLMLLVTLLQSFFWTQGMEQITAYLALAALVSGLLLPIYRPECILGYVLGAAPVFGTVIPLAGVLVMAALSYLVHRWLWPLIWRSRLSRSDTA